MRRPQGYIIITDPDAPTVEFDTITCAHCNRIVIVKPKEDPASLGGFCGMCTKYICSACNAQGSCTPFERKLEESERRDRLRRQMGL